MFFFLSEYKLKKPKEGMHWNVCVRVFIVHLGFYTLSGLTLEWSHINGFVQKC